MRNEKPVFVIVEVAPHPIHAMAARRNSANSWDKAIDSILNELFQPATFHDYNEDYRLQGLSSEEIYALLFDAADLP